MKEAEFFSTVGRWQGALVLAALYLVAALASRFLTASPGGTSVVWLPSGLVLGALLIREKQLWPGAFIGALIACTVQFSTAAGMVAALLVGLANGVGVVFSALLATSVLNRHGTAAGIPDDPAQLRRLVLFGVVAGPFCSALISTSAIAAAGLIEPSMFALHLTTWWFGDGLGVLLVTPALLVYCLDRPRRHRRGTLSEQVLFAAIVAVLPFSTILFPASLPLQLMALYSAIPVLLWGLVQMGERATIAAIMYFVAVRIGLFQGNHGVFSDNDVTTSIFILQGFLAFALLTAFTIASVLAQNRRLVISLREQVVHDALTGAFNRRYMERQIKIAIERHARYHTVFTVIMADIDHFKRLNDRYGHATGDQALIKLVHIITASTRDIDVLARWGGEEFVILMPDTAADSAAQYADRLRRQVEQTQMPASGTLTISMGVAAYCGEESGPALMERVDQAMYQAKNGGRNQIVVSEGTTALAKNSRESGGQ